MTYLWLRRAQAQQLIKHAQDAAPDEACGLILGDQQRVNAIVPTENIAANPRHHYRIDDRALIENFDRIIGIYHSHPRSQAIPSSTDIQESCYPEFVHVIIGLQGKSPQIAAWHIRHGRVESVQVIINDQPPQDIPKALTQTQQAVLLVSALAVVMAVIFISLMLLPPAPPIQ